MAISFACPHCGKTFEISESAAGKRGRCKRCETVFVIPNATVPRPPDTKTRAYDLYDEDEEPSPGRSVGASPLVKEGTRIDLIAVEESSSDRLELAVKTTRLLLWLIGGTVAIVVGMLLIAVAERSIEKADGPIRVPQLVLMIPFALIGVGVFGICCSARFGTRLTFDRRTRSLSVRRLLIWETTWEAEELDRLVFVVLKPQEKNCRPSSSPQACEAYVVDGRGRAVAMIEQVSRNRPKDFQPLAMACLQAGQLLGIPVSVTELAEPIHPDLRRAVECLRGADTRRGLRRAPAFRKPLLTVYNVGSVVAGVVMLTGLGRFMLKWTDMGHKITDAVAAIAPAGAPVGPGGAPVGPGGAPVGPGGAPVGSGGAPVGPGGPRGPWRGQQALLRMNERELDRLLGEAGSPDEQTRQSALWQLESRDPGDRREAVRQAATKSLDATSPRERERAVNILGRWGTDDDLARAVAFIDDPEPAVRNAVAAAIARRKYGPGATAMARRLREPHDRFTMGIRLKEFGPGAAPVVVELLDDPDDEVKFAAAMILETIGTTAELDALNAASRRYEAVAARPFGRGNPPGDADAMGQVHFAHRINPILARAINAAEGRRPAP